jgi:phosphoserine aminotransferase
VSQEYKVLFLQGGASLQFAMLPMNLREVGQSADYIVNGTWGVAALKDARNLGAARAAGSSENTNFDRVPEEIELDPGAAYLHYTSNETVHGVQWRDEPEPPAGVPLVCDMSSDFLSRPVEVSKYGLIYAGAQKNAGPAGVTVVIVREELLGRVPKGLPVMLDYRLQAEKGSMHNTPPCFAIYMAGLVLKWLKGEGGLGAIAEHNREKARLIYQKIDESGGFYRGHAIKDSRSLMNVTFWLPSEELEEQFVWQAGAEGLVGLRGHRSLGGMRASLYNAVSVESALVLAQFMAEFLIRNG